MDKLSSLRTLIGLSLFLVIAFFIFGKIWLLIISAIFLVISLFDWKLTNFIAEFWYKLGQLIGTLISKLILIVLFYLLVTPLGTFYRLFNRNIYNFFRNKNRGSFFKDVNMEYKKNDFEKLW